MNKVIVGLVGVASLSFAACGGEAPDSGETGSLGQDLVLGPDLVAADSTLRQPPAGSVRLNPRDPKGGNRFYAQESYDSVLAALATAVLKCKGSLTAEDFAIGKSNEIGNPSRIGDPNIKIFPVLVPKMTACPLDKQQLEEINLMVGIQLLERSDAARQFVEAWRAYSDRVKGVECPMWDQAEEIDPPTEKSVAAYVADPKGSPHKTNYLWKIQTTQQCQLDPRCSVDAAATCGSWAGSKFIVETDPSGSIKTDPEWWWDNTKYSPTPFAYGYEHPMAETGFHPGDIYGALNRELEYCSLYVDYVNIAHNRVLRPIDCDGFGWYCVTMCSYY